jgi:hypothetical protein
MDPNIPTKGFFTNVRYMFDLRDVVVDVQGAQRGVLQPRRGRACACWRRLTRSTQSSQW